MALSKQSIRFNHSIYLNKSTDKLAPKDEVINLSELWSENEIFLFKKLLRQGGSATIQGTHFRVVIQEKMRNIGEM